MPDQAIHHFFGQSVLSALPDSFNIDHGVFDFALSGPDDWFYCFTDPKICARGSYMHRNKTGAFLSALASEPQLFSYFSGYACHYFLDLNCHPYIIARTGMYDLTWSSRKYRGNHTAFERALDRWILQDNDSRHPITDEMLGKMLPSELEQPITMAYYSVFGWKHVYRDLLTAKEKMRKYLRILEDPSGAAKLLTTAVPHPMLRPLPYSRHYYSEEDILNLGHKKWHHPKDPSLEYTSSFLDLMEEALNQAVNAIAAVHDGDLSLIGNRSYLTGLELDDKRNNAKDTYSLLKR